MPTYDVRIDVRSVYGIMIVARDSTEATRKGEMMQTEMIRKDGRLIDVETAVAEVTKIKGG